PPLFPVRAHPRILAAHASEVCHPFPPSETRGRGECRVPSAPAASCAEVLVEMHTSVHSEVTGIIRHSRTQWFTAYSALSLATGLSCHHRRGVRTTRFCRPRQVLSSSAPSASTASRPAFVTIANAPRVGQDGGGHRTDLGPASRIIS